MSKRNCDKELPTVAQLRQTENPNKKHLCSWFLFCFCKKLTIFCTKLLYLKLMLATVISLGFSAVAGINSPQNKTCSSRVLLKLHSSNYQKIPWSRYYKNCLLNKNAIANKQENKRLKGVLVKLFQF